MFTSLMRLMNRLKTRTYCAPKTVSDTPDEPGVLFDTWFVARFRRKLS